jgi:hypothetical protein
MKHHRRIAKKMLKNSSRFHSIIFLQTRWFKSRIHKQTSKTLKLAMKSCRIFCKNSIQVYSWWVRSLWVCTKWREIPLHRRNSLLSRRIFSLISITINKSFLLNSSHNIAWLMPPNSKNWTRKEENLSDWPKRRCWLSILQELIHQILWDTSLMHSTSITNTLALGLFRDRNPWEAMITILRILEKKASFTKVMHFPFEHFLTYLMRPSMRCF